MWQNFLSCFFSLFFFSLSFSFLFSLLFFFLLFLHPSSCALFSGQTQCGRSQSRVVNKMARQQHENFRQTAGSSSFVLTTEQLEQFLQIRTLGCRNCSSTVWKMTAFLGTVSWRLCRQERRLQQNNWDLFTSGLQIAIYLWNLSKWKTVLYIREEIGNRITSAIDRTDLVDLLFSGPIRAGSHSCI